MLKLLFVDYRYTIQPQQIALLERPSAYLSHFCKQISGDDVL